MFFLDIPPTEARRRIVQARKSTEIFEQIADLKKVRQRGFPWRLLATGPFLEPTDPLLRLNWISEEPLGCLEIFKGQ